MNNLKLKQSLTLPVGLQKWMKRQNNMEKIRKAELKLTRYANMIDRPFQSLMSPKRKEPDGNECFCDK